MLAWRATTQDPCQRGLKQQAENAIAEKQQRPHEIVIL